MAPTFGPLLALLFAATVLAGCSANVSPTTGDAGLDPAEPVGRAPEAERPSHEPTQAPASGTTAKATRVNQTRDEVTRDDPPSNETRVEVVYEFSGNLVGASAPNLSGPGPLIEQIPVAKKDTFEAPPGTVALGFSFQLNPWLSTGSGRVEVTGPNGELVHTSDWTWIGFPVYAGRGWGSWTAEEAGPGTYTVLYYVAGSFEMRARANATVLGGAVAGEPVVFTGHVYAPDARPYLGRETCEGFYGDEYDYRAYDYFVAPLSTNSHALEADYTGWSFAFNVDTMAASFSTPGTPQPAEPSGMVPAGATRVYACSVTGVDTDYQLTLSPPV